MERNARFVRRRWGARNKTRRWCSARAGWHSFDEYTFLEDSRYASQRENAGRKRGFRDAGRQVFLTGNNRQYFSCKAAIASAGRASVAVQKSASFLQRVRNADF
jgi:hypothetical protein